MSVTPASGEFFSASTSDQKYEASISSDVTEFGFWKSPLGNFRLLSL